MSLAPDLHRDEIADRIADLIAELGDTADAIAYHLAEAGITGRRADAMCCPIAVYLRRQVPCIDSIAVFGDSIDVNTETGDSVTLTAPDEINEFVTLFDTQHYPHLLRPEATR
jgi:hypothetical protein